jgi:hypothetical protein
MLSKLTSSFIRLLLLGVFFLLLYAPDRFGISFAYPLAPLSDSLFLRGCKAVLWFLIAAELLRCFYYGVVKNTSRGIFSNLMTVVFPLSLFLIFLEVIFMFVPQSHEGVLSKASQIWWAKYWRPINSLGYRDVEPEPAAGKKQVLVIGDSFSAGHGLESVNERFSNILGDKLGEGYEVRNLGVSGSDSGDEAQRLVAYPVKPDAIVLQYFPNDIERVAQESGLTITGGKPFDDISGITAQLVRRFYLPNFIYWQLPHAQFSSFDQFVTAAYSDSTVLKKHFDDLSKIVAYGDSTGAEVYAVFVPFLFQLDKSAGYTRQVEEFLTQNGVKVVTLNEEIAKIAEKDRIVGRNDGHASAVVNAAIAERLYAAFTRR